MRIGEWSSDVCPSDLYVDIRIIVPAPFRCIYAIARKDDVGLRHLYLRHGVTGARHHVGLIGEGKALVAARDGESRLARRRDFNQRHVLIPAFTIARQIGRAHVELQSLMRISYAVFYLTKKNLFFFITYSSHL